MQRELRLSGRARDPGHRARHESERHLPGVRSLVHLDAVATPRARIALDRSYLARSREPGHHSAIRSRVAVPGSHFSRLAPSEGGSSRIRQPALIAVFLLSSYQTQGRLHSRRLRERAPRRAPSL